MLNALLAAALSFNCSITPLTGIGFENDGKLYRYKTPSKEKVQLIAGGMIYECTEDYPSGIGAALFTDQTAALGAGIKTLKRNKCGPLTFFFQSYRKKCNRADYSPAPSYLLHYDDREELLEVRRECLKYGNKYSSSWWRLRDKRGVEWDLTYMPGLETMDARSDTCSEAQRVSIRKEFYKLEKTGDIIEIVRTMTSPIESLNEKRMPSF